MRKEIVLPAHLYDRIKASAGEHGGIGSGELFTQHDTGEPLCAHGHAWGTCTRYLENKWSVGHYQEPELAKYLTFDANDEAIDRVFGFANRYLRNRVPFDQWCELLNVKRGEDVPRETPAERQTEMATV